MDYGIAARQRQIMADMDTSPAAAAKKKQAPVTQPVLGAVKQPSYMPGPQNANPEAPEITYQMPTNIGATQQMATPAAPTSGAGPDPGVTGGKAATSGGEGAAKFDEGGKVNILDKAADYAQNLYAQARALLTPEDSEAAGLKAKQENVDQVAQPYGAAPATPPSTTASPSPMDQVNPVPYGQRPGEKAIDTTDMRKPLGQAPAAAPQPYKMQGSSLYDEGGEVDLDGDGKKDHEKALLSDGERVLTPEEAAQYEKEHPEVKNDGREGQPVNYGAPAAPPQAMPSEPSAEATPAAAPEQVAAPQPVVAQATPQAAAPVAPMMAQATPPPNPAAQEIVPRAETNGAEPQPYGEPKQPSYQPGKEPVTPPDAHEDMRKVLEQKKGEAALKGDLLGLGAAIIGEKAIAPTYQGPLAQGIEQPKPGEPVPTGQQAYQQKMGYYQKAYQDALDDFSPEGKERAANIKEAMLNYEKTHPYGAPESAKPGFFGKVEHALADVGNVAGAAMAPAAEMAIPQSLLGREAERRRAEALGAEGSKEALEAAQTESAKVETQIKRLGAPQELTGDQNVRTNTGTGKRERAYKYLDGTVRWVPEGMSPLDPQFYVPPRFDLFSGKTPQVGAVPAKIAPETPTNVSGVTTENNTAAAAAAAAAAPPQVATGGAPQYVYGEKPDAEHMPASKAELGTLNASIKAMPSLSAEQRAALAFPPGYTPTVADVKDRLGVLEKMQNAQRQVSQDQFNDQLKKIMLQNQEIMMEQHLEDEKLKHDQLFANNAAAADSGYAALASQEVYNDAMKTWFKDPAYGKDVILVTNMINEAKNQTGSFSSWGSDAGIGGMLGGVGGAMVGGAVGIVAQAVKGPADAALETLYKNHISDAGYKAMQAYFNSIPGRLNFETNVMNVKATAMKMREVMRSLMNTVPSPNTPERTWDDSFNLYFKPMKNLTDRKVKNLDLPQGYTKPTRETLGFPAAPRVENPRPAGATHHGISNVDGIDYYLDKNGKKLGPRYQMPTE